jgi:hypothetical protein
MVSRRSLLIGTGMAVAAAGGGYVAWPGDDAAYRDALEANRKSLLALNGADLNSAELVRFAALAANSHNTQPWLFQSSNGLMRVGPDASRRCPVGDPENRHLVASLGCATENLVLASAASGYEADVEFRGPERTADISFERTTPRSSPAFAAITKRQSTRAPFDPMPLAPEDLRTLEAASAKPGVR